MFEVLTVCTGNICRSPLAEQLLHTRLGAAGLTASVASAGTRGLHESPMTPESVRLAEALGVPADDAHRHRSRYLTENHLRSPDLIFAMSREHRTAIAELAPGRIRSTFTIREFARLAGGVPEAALREAAEAAGPDASARVRAVAAAVASHRGVLPPPDDPADDDVIDPYRRSWATYELSAAQLVPAVETTVRVLRAAFAPA